MENQVLQIIWAIILGIVSSLLAYLLTKLIEKKSNENLKEFKTFQFYLGFISLICSFISFVGIIISIISIWINGRHLMRGKTKAYLISFLLSIIALTISSFITGVKDITPWYLTRRDRFEMFNTMPNDLPMLRAINLSTTPRELSYTTPGYWRKRIKANVNDTIAFNVYYHNTGDRDAKDVCIRFHYNQDGNILLCGVALSEKFSNNVYLDYASVTIEDSIEKEEYFLDFNAAYWYPDQKAAKSSLPFGQSGIECIYLDGLNIGTIEKGNWEHQGNLNLQFVIHGFLYSNNFER